MKKWIVKHSESKDAFNIIGTELGGKYKIARVPYIVTETLKDVNKREKAEAKRHADIMSSAPEMLLLLKQISEENYKFCDWDAIDELIKKATTI